MKKLLLLIGLLSATSAFTQTDTCTLTNGKIITGKVLKYYSDRLLLDMEKEEVIVHYPSLTYFSNGKERVQRMNDLERYYEFGSWNDSKHYLRTAAAIGAGSIGLQLLGGALCGLGAWKSNNVLLYAGAGIGGAGFVMQLPAWIMLMKSADVPEYKEF